MINRYYNTLQRIAWITGLTGVVLIIVTLPLTGCTYSDSPAESPNVQSTALVSTAEQDALDKSIAAHGGLDRWKSFGSLEYTVERRGRSEHHLIDLYSRRTLQTGESFQIGYDGTDVWVSPSLDAYAGNARFMNGLDFYFFAIPFVLADPGTHREYLGKVLINDEPYEAVKISYDDGVGASPDDYYIVHLDPETFQLKILLYTATFRSQTPSENYNARVYEDWKEINGLLLPTRMIAASWDAAERRLGESRGETLYTDITLTVTQPDPALFAPPTESEIAAP